MATSTKRAVTRVTVDLHGHKRKAIVIQVGSGDLIRFRYKGTRTWFEDSIPACLQHAAAKHGEAEKIAKKLARGQKIWNK